MTHSLHRRGSYEELENDFIVLGCPATGVNKVGSAPKTQKFLSICYKVGPINLGDMKTGNIYNTTMEDKIVTLLKELKKDRPGISVTISGVTDIVEQCMQEAGLGHIHSLEYSLGTWGKTEKLPDFEILKTVTMCGHAMIASDLVRKMVRDVKRGRRTIRQCVVELAECCSCGNYNLTRGEKLFKEMLATYMVHTLY